jgi:hypothetical protein
MREAIRIRNKCHGPSHHTTGLSNMLLGKILSAALILFCTYAVLAGPYGYRFLLPICCNSIK